MKLYLITIILCCEVSLKIIAQESLENNIKDVFKKFGTTLKETAEDVGVSLKGVATTIKKGANDLGENIKQKKENITNSIEGAIIGVSGDIINEDEVLAQMSDQPGDYSFYPIGQQDPRNKNDTIIRIATYNIQIGPGGLSGFVHQLNGKNRWYYQTKMILDMVNQFKFDIVGTQELHNRESDALEKKLSGYKWIKKEKKNKYESSAIFYNTNRLELIDSGYFWLNSKNETNETGWGSTFPRNVVWIHGKVKSSKKEFFIFNTHLDYNKNFTMGNMVHKKELKMIIDESEKFNPNKLPCFIMGDFNTNEENSIEILKNHDYFNVAREENIHTYIRYPFTYIGIWNQNRLPSSSKEKESLMGSVIDWIFFNKNKCKAINSGIIIRADGKIASDHLPLFADIELP